MADDYGTCISCVSDVGARWKYVSGPRVVAEALVRRLSTPRGKLKYDLEYGTDMRDYLNHGTTPQGRFEAAQAAEAECLKDERVDSVALDASYNFATQTLNITLGVKLTTGVTFKLVVAVSALSVDLLEAA